MSDLQDELNLRRTLMPTELQDALDRIDAWEVRPDQIPIDNLTTQLMYDLGIAVEAARRVANPNYEAAHDVMWGNKTVDKTDGRRIQQAIQAALGTPDDRE